MKKLALLMLVAALLAACQPVATPTPAPTPAPVEALASSVSDLVGIWKVTPENVMIEFKADGTFRVFAGSETLDDGAYTFDAGKISWGSTSGCVNKPATYEAYVTKQDGKLVGMRLQVVGSDNCSDRARVTAGTGKLQTP